MAGRGESGDEREFVAALIWEAVLRNSRKIQVQISLLYLRFTAPIGCLPFRTRLIIFPFAALAAMSPPAILRPI